MVTSSDPDEWALRQLPTAYSLALRMRGAGVDDEVICEYLHLEPPALETLMRLAEDKLRAVHAKRDR